MRAADKLLRALGESARSKIELAAKRAHKNRPYAHSLMQETANVLGCHLLVLRAAVRKLKIDTSALGA
jgi:hypothetical protein